MTASRLMILAGLLLTAGAALAAPEVVVLRGDSLAEASANLRNEVNDQAQRCLSALRSVGLPAKLVSDVGVTAEALAGAPLVVLPYNRLSDEQVDQLAAHTRAGGRLLALFTTGSDKLPELLGVKLGELSKPKTEGELARITFDSAAQRLVPLLPASLGQDSWNAFELAPAEGSVVLGRWGEQGRPAVVGNGAGYYVGHVFTGADLPAKSRLMLALALQTTPELWPIVIDSAQERVNTAVGFANAQLSLLRQRGDRQSAHLTDLAAKVQAVSQAGPRGGSDQTRLASLMDREVEADALLAQLQPSRRFELRGLWVFGGRQDWPALVAKCQKAGLNAIFLRVGRGGNVIYPSDILPQDEWSKERDEVALALAACHAGGIELHAWRVTYHLGSAPAAYREQLRAEGRISVNPTGQEAPFANPADPRNYALEVAVAREFLEKYDVDGIHLDYIRYTDEPSYDFDYSEVSHQEFAKALGRDVPDWPNSVLTGPLQTEYNRFMRDQIDRLVEANHRLVVQLRPHAVLSAAVWRDPRYDRQRIKQDWPKWVQNGWMDLLVPMNYTTSASTLDDYVTRQLAETQGQTRYASGLGAWLLDTPADLIEQIALSRAGGADGWVLFSNNAPDLDRQLAALSAGVSRLPAVPSTRGPQVRWEVEGTMSLRGVANGLVAGAQVPVTAVIGPRWGTLRANIKKFSARLDVVEPGFDRTLGTAGETTFEGNSGRLSGQFEALRGRFQLVLRGAAEDAAGAKHDFEVRGPLFNGWDSEQTHLWRSAQLPVKRIGAPLSIGVYYDGIGADQLLAALAPAGSLESHALLRLTPEFLAPFDAVVIPQLRDVEDLGPEAAAALRTWVEAGGTLLLTHDAVGWRYHPSLFPEIGRGTALSRGRAVAATVDWPRAGANFEHLYADHVQLQPGPSGTVLWKDVTDLPVLVAGPVGQGRVILDGMLTGYVGDSETVPAPELELLLDALRLGRPGAANEG